MEQYGTVFDIYDSLPLEGKYKYIQSVNEMGEQLLVNVELMDLMTYCDDALGEKNTQVVDLELARVLNDNKD